MDFNIQCNKGFLIIENFYRSEKIKIDSIEEILIFHHGERYNNRINFYLNSAIIYEQKGKNIFNKILFNIFTFFHKEKYVIEEKYHDPVLIKLLNTLNNNLPSIIVPKDLENSMFWKTIDNGYSFPMVKLIYSRKKMSLKDVLKKYNKIQHSEK